MIDIIQYNSTGTLTSLVVVFVAMYVHHGLIGCYFSTTIVCSNIKYCSRLVLLLFLVFVHTYHSILYIATVYS
jgi:hypothetical protein